jgi:hypothetical protein
LGFNDLILDSSPGQPCSRLPEVTKTFQNDNEYYKHATIRLFIWFCSPKVAQECLFFFSTLVMADRIIIKHPLLAKNIKFIAY